MTEPYEKIEDEALEKILEDVKLDDFHFIVKYGRKREE